MKSVKVRRTQELEVEGLGLRIQQARKASEQSLTALAAAAGISRVYWHDIENERVRDSLPEETLRRIEQVLGVDLGVRFE